MHELSDSGQQAVRMNSLYHFVHLAVNKRDRIFLQAMLPKWRDATDLIEVLLYNLGARKEEPRFAKFNYAEKLEYWALLWGTLKRPLALHEAHRRSARNLAHSLALRRHDVRKLQSQLAFLGLSSLGRTESHVFTAVQSVHRALNALLGTNGSLPCPEEPAVEIGEGTELLEANADALLGPPPPGIKVRIITRDRRVGQTHRVPPV
jgi:hypothetical protein